MNTEITVDETPSSVLPTHVVVKATDMHNVGDALFIVGLLVAKGNKMQNRWGATLVVTLLLSISSLLACGGRKVHMTPASTQPAAQGVATLKHDKNGNLTVDLKLKHLAAPQNLTPPKSTYIVWIQPTTGEVHKLGELRVNDKLEGEFKAPVPTSNFQIFVTAEDGPTVAQPSGPEVLRQTVGVGHS